MPELKKATLQTVFADDSRRTIGDPIVIQFNPASLKLRYSNQVNGGQTRGQQIVQFMGSSSTTLTLELIFDTADEGTTASPRSVREKVRALQQLVLPSEDNNETPPKVRFEWSEIVVEGIVTTLDVDYDFFAHNGVPLRAKANFTITEQDSRYRFLARGPGARDAASASPPGLPPPGAPGGPPPRPGNRVALALAGETAADFAARMGLDPQAWRGLDVDLRAGLSLQAGIEVGFSASLEPGLSLGLEAGFEAGASISLAGGLEAALGISAGADLSLSAASPARASATAGGGTAPGFALADAGGVVSALETIKVSRAGAAAASARSAFAVPPAADAGAADAGVRATTVSAPGGTGATQLRPTQPRPPLVRTGVPGPAAQAAALPAPLPPLLDARAAAFGFGVPLKPRRGTAASSRTDVSPPFLIVGRPSATTAAGEPPVTRDRTVAPWIALPAVDAARDQATANARRGGGACDCTCDDTGRRR